MHESGTTDQNFALARCAHAQLSLVPRAGYGAFLDLGRSSSAVNRVTHSPSSGARSSTSLALTRTRTEGEDCDMNRGSLEFIALHHFVTLGLSFITFLAKNLR